MKYPCPCCSYEVHNEPPGSYAICPVCFWEDDESQLRFPNLAGGANIPSLIQAQKNFFSIGAKEERVRIYVRNPRVDEIKDPTWRPIDPKQDMNKYPDSEENFDLSPKGYPDDKVKLYYWR